MGNTVHADYYEAESFWAGEALKDTGNMCRIARTIEVVPAQTKSLLDVGCGNGVFGHALIENRPEIKVTGVDRSEAALKHVKFTSQAASIDDLPFADHSFDAVSCLQVIEHLPNAIYQTSLKELARVASKHIIIGVPFDEDLEAETTRCPQCRTMFNINLHLRSFQLLDIDSLFSDFGFKMASHIFPAAKRRTKYVNEIVSALRRKKQTDPGFLSPICPVCSYTEGDRTALSSSSQGTVDGNTSSHSRSWFKWSAKKVFNAASKMLPKEDVKGYWVIALFERG